MRKQTRVPLTFSYFAVPATMHMTRGHENEVMEGNEER